MTSAEQRNHRVGLLLVAAAALSWSSAGLFTRYISADLFTLLFFRGLFSGAAQALLFLWIERGNVMPTLKSLRWPTAAVAFFSAMSMICGIGSLRFGTVADAMVIYATVPFVTAGLAYMVIGEKPGRSTLIASLAALFGVAIMLWGKPVGGSFIGQILAVGMTFGMACFTTIMRQHRDVPMLPAMAASAWLCSLAVLPWSSPASISASDFMLCAAFGVFQNAAGLALYTFGSKRIPAAEATLLAALEVPFTPLWVFLILGETPALPTLVGGGIVLVALFAHILSEFRGKTKEVEGEFPLAP
jgi:drug/metabolite transporter (DMT)-like permease